MFINNIVLGCPVCIVGIVGNAVNLIVFYKQGFGDTINVTMFALALSDLSLLISSLWMNFLSAPWLHRSFLGFEPRDVMLLTGGWPHICFSRITCWITVFITFERCLCITLPFKVKQILTPKVVFVAVVWIYFLSFIGISPCYVSFGLMWWVDPWTNMTYIGSTMMLNEQVFIKNTYLQLSLQFISFVAIVALTITLVIQLQQNTKWRASATTKTEQTGAMSNRDRRIVRMIILITFILIACFCPGNLLQVAWLIEPKFSTGGVYNNGQMACWMFAFLMETINSSANVFVYYNMSTKYREIFQQLFCGKEDAKLKR
ncbi:unnamed protein product [Lymnaea stagnalis]|uniref:G-protein coupled receptors family 1 profile domain-containing protein n=1 Tax=Lymnaea stagnalis TaxID=6523 RepID=A0AAV2I3P6_LYMST